MYIIDDTCSKQMNPIEYFHAYIDGFVRDCNIPSVLATEIL